MCRSKMDASTEITTGGDSAVGVPSSRHGKANASDGSSLDAISWILGAHGDLCYQMASCVLDHTRLHCTALQAREAWLLIQMSAAASCGEGRV
uniref:Cycp3 n=1 Tax=Arundo donax TaxID=35708 RepID=A0A0A9EXE6_ARUDO